MLVQLGRGGHRVEERCDATYGYWSQIQVEDADFFGSEGFTVAAALNDIFDLDCSEFHCLLHLFFLDMSRHYPCLAF